MKKGLFIEKLAAQSDLSQAQGRQFLAAMTTVVTALLAERQLRHPMTGKCMVSPAAQVPTFKVSKVLKAALNVTA